MCSVLAELMLAFNKNQKIKALPGSDLHFIHNNNLMRDIGHLFVRQNVRASLEGPVIPNWELIKFPYRMIILRNVSFSAGCVKTLPNHKA